MAKGRATTRYYFPECLDNCGWVAEQGSRNGLGLGAQHAKRTGHRVRVGVEYAIYYAEGKE